MLNYSCSAPQVKATQIIQNFMNLHEGFERRMKDLKLHMQAKKRFDMCERGPVWTVIAEAKEGEKSKDIQV